MKRLLISALAAASLAAVGAPALAQPFGGDINARERNIAERIDQGALRGDLTRGEARSLRNELRSIERLEQRYRHNGYRYRNRGPAGLSAWERRDLERRLDSLNARVFRNRHDADHRPRRH